MTGAVLVGTLAFALARRRSRAWLGQPMQLPSASAITPRAMLAGMALFEVVERVRRGR